MRVLMSAAIPEGHLVVLRVPPGVELVLCAPGVDTELPRPLAEPAEVSVTEWACDLALLGLAQHAERVAGEAPTEEVALGHVELRGLSGEALDPLEVDGTALYLHPQAQVAQEFSLTELLGMVARGVQAQLTAGVAADIAEAEMPSSPESLPPPGASSAG